VTTLDAKRRAAQLRRIADASSLGLAFPIAIALGYFFGAWLDKIFACSPWCTVIFSVFGVAAGFLNAIRTALRIGREEDEAAGGNNGGG
jgi:F0F1-type ATP synthase assembly protein I